METTAQRFHASLVAGSQLPAIVGIAGDGGGGLDFLLREVRASG